MTFIPREGIKEGLLELCLSEPHLGRGTLPSLYSRYSAYRLYPCVSSTIVPTLSHTGFAPTLTASSSCVCVCASAGRALLDDAPACRPLLRKEVLRLIVNLSSSVGTKGHETGLLT